MCHSLLAAFHREKAFIGRRKGRVSINSLSPAQSASSPGEKEDLGG